MSVPPQYPNHAPGTATTVGGRDPTSGGTHPGMPQRFGKYTLLRKLATGGMAELFLALQKSVAGFEKLIVIKRILPQMNQDAAFISMLLHEARVAATLSHPNIVQIFDVGEVDGVFFIAMEHVHGEDIRQIVRQMKVMNMPEFPREHALGIILGVCAGLAYAHDKRNLDGSPLHIVHRDISPQNVVVTFDGDIKVVDFGIAKSDGKLQADTKSGKLKGKVPYMSPEQALGEDLDARSDIFSTGVMLFELTTGRRLFKGQSEYETLKLICDRAYPRPSQVIPEYPPELEEIVVRALAKDRNERYQTAREMQAALEAYVRKEQIVVSNLQRQQFMQTLFAEKLASQNEDLAQGKHLAEIIEASDLARRAIGAYASDAPPSVETGDGGRISGFPSMPPASRTLTDVGGRSFLFRKRNLPFVVGGAASAMLLLIAVSAIVFGSRSKRTEGPVVAAAPSSIEASQPAPPPVVLAPRGAIEVSSDPPGAAIWLDGQLQTRSTPATLPDLPLGRSIEIKLTKDGFLTERQSVSLDEVHKVAKVEKTLRTRSGGGSGGGAAGAGSGATPPKRAAAAAVEGVKGSGKLNVAALGGWCNVSVDGKGYGATPVAQIELAAGNHRVVCTTADGRPHAANVTVPADGTARHRFTL